MHCSVVMWQRTRSGVGPEECSSGAAKQKLDPTEAENLRSPVPLLILTCQSVVHQTPVSANGQSRIGSYCSNTARRSLYWDLPGIELEMIIVQGL